MVKLYKSKPSRATAKTDAFLQQTSTLDPRRSGAVPQPPCRPIWFALH